MSDVAELVREEGWVGWEEAADELMERLGIDRSGAELLICRALRKGEVQARLRGLPWRKIWTLEDE